MADPRGATAAGLALARKCLRLGGEWILKDDFTGSINFLKLKKEFQEELEESWATFVKESTTAQGGSVGAGATSASAAAQAASATGPHAGKAAKAAASKGKQRLAETDKEIAAGKSKKSQNSDAEAGCGFGGSQSPQGHAANHVRQLHYYDQAGGE